MATMKHPDPGAVVKRAFFLAWQACGGPLGLGHMQNRGPDMTEDQVWDQAFNRRDYPGGNDDGFNETGDVYGDYVFGRMMKLGLKWKDGEVEYPDSTPVGSYQAWAKKYPSYPVLLTAAIDSLTPTPA